MRKLLIIGINFFMLLGSLNSYASDAIEKLYLMQILNQLQAIKPLILSAEKAQPTTNRIKFHYASYKDNQGKVHNGLWDDINSIERGINEKLNSVQNSEHIFQPILGDYINHNRNHTSW